MIVIIGLFAIGISGLFSSLLLIYFGIGYSEGILSKVIFSLSGIGGIYFNVKILALALDKKKKLLEYDLQSNEGPKEKSKKKRKKRKRIRN